VHVPSPYKKAKEIHSQNGPDLLTVIHGNAILVLAKVREASMTATFWGPFSFAVKSPVGSVISDCGYGSR
jgi:hypothetical protein